MPGRSLLDTNAAIAILEGEGVLEALPEDSEVYLNIVVLGELYYGAHASGRVDANLQRIDRLTALCPVLGCDQETARQYALIKSQLRKKGRPIPDNDLWVAASAEQYGLSVISRDRHFEHIDGLELVGW